MIKTVFNTSSVIKDNRTHYDVLASLMEEVGELSQEIRIKEGASYKQPGTDGIIGESIDVIAVALDMIYITNPEITEEELIYMLAVKIAKWKNKRKEYVIENGKD